MSERAFDGGGEGYCLFSGLEKSMLGMSNSTTSFRAAADPSHVAQQSRRDKLRVQHNSNQATPSSTTTTTLNINQDHHLHHLHHQSREGLPLSPDVNNVNLMMYSPDMLTFASGAHFNLGHNQLAGGRPESSSAGGANTYWGSGTGNNNYLGGNVCNNELVSSSPNLDLVNGGTGVVMSSCLKPAHGTGYNQEHHVVQSSILNNINPAVVPVVPTELSNQTAAAAPPDHHAHKLQIRENPIMGCNFVTSSPSFYQDHHLVTSTSPTINAPSHPFLNIPMASRPDSGHGSSWNAAAGGNELVLLPSFTPGQWSSRNMEMNNSTCTSTGTGTDNASQRLSLSLSSHQPSEAFPSRCVATGAAGRGVLGGAKFFGNSIQSVVSTSSTGGTSSSMDLRRAVGPLGPFTGYATILKSSRFLKPARQLLDELCCFSASTSPKLVKASGTTSSIILPHERENSGEPSTSSDVFNVDCDPGAGGLSGNSGGSASTPNFYGSPESGSDLYQGIRPEFQRRKAKLLSMQEEVGKRYKQYHQQMQMVMSSFESVAGLTAATPYISFALKSVTKHFRSLKQAISEQIRTVSKALGEELISIASIKDDVAMQKLRFFEHSFRKHKVGDNLAFLEHQQPVWRPQRGLPERAVAVLRAWLFEHFLHPYPTDTDKHMLAAQTGLSRNQVSNWFINARVRVWKPMVEEIHMLETKGSAEVDLNRVKIDGKGVAAAAAAAARKAGRPCMNLPSEPTGAEVLSQKPSNCSNAAVPLNDSSHGKGDLDQWHPADKRSKMEECQISRALDGGMMGFLPYPSGMEMLGAGSVSLTLGLRHSAENMQHKQHLQQQQQQQQQQHHMILQQHQREQQLRQLGGHHLAHDFTGL